ncbi:serine-rich adhesin for platelets [Biomphalaria glabrata]|nr:serine-rich adhesin for platelets [Biomphalaria glabrata]
MEEEGDVVYQGEVFKLSEAKKRLIGSKAGSWKAKYLIFRLKSDKPILEYHKRKPKHNKKHEKTITDSVELWPTFKVEKLKNARGRTYVCEITSPAHHIFLSVNEEKELDVLVFLLQVQIRLKSNIRDDLITVLPEDTECLRKIGAAGCTCILHASPWGLTLALEKTRALLAQWPLKSIRYYEVPAPGHFNIEAGRVAPMGEGLFQFKTQGGEEDFMYDLVDSYIVNTLDRVKPTQKGTPEEIEDYIREHECLHSLTAITVCSKQEPEIRNILSKTWNIPNSLSEEFSPGQQRSLSENRERAQFSPERQVQASSLIVNLERPDTSRNGHHASDEIRITDRPPPPPTRSTNGGRPRRSQRREHSIPRKVDIPSVSSDVHSPNPGSPGIALVMPSSGNKKRPPTSLNFSTDVSHGEVHRHTEFYNLSSPNMKVRKSKSPIITRNTNKVGRAEYLMSQQQSGVKSPTISLSENRGFGGTNSLERNALSKSPGSISDYRNTDHRGSDLGQIGQDTSADHLQEKLSKNVSGSEQSVISGSSFSARGYINLQDDSNERDSHHQRQVSVPETMASSSVPHYNRFISKESMSSDVFSPPVVRHIRQRSADELSHVSFDSTDGKVHSSHPSSYGRQHLDSRPESEVSRISEDFHEVGRGVASRKVSGLDSIDDTVSEWLMSASCEDLSDHMKTVIYDDNNNGKNSSSPDEAKLNTVKDVDSSLTLSSNGSSTSNEKPPLPFTGLKKFHDNTDVGGGRDRSRSFGYMNLPPNSVTVTSSPRVQSSAPSAHLIRKMVNVRAKQETLRKSLSNPNFLNLGSKEHLFNLKTASNGASSKLNTEAKQKSKSFSSLFPAIKKAFSRESLGHSRSTTPERRHSRNSTPERRSSFSLRRRGSDSESNFKRQNSFHTIGEMTIKGVRMTERSRSFRKVRGAKSVEALSRTPDEADMGRLSSATTASCPPTDGLRGTSSRHTASSRVSDMSRNIDAHSSVEVRHSDLHSTVPARNSAPLSATNPNYVTTARIELSPTMVPAQPAEPPLPPLPARVKLDVNLGLNEVVKVTQDPGGPEKSVGYLNVLTDYSPSSHESKLSLSSSTGLTETIEKPSNCSFDQVSATHESDYHNYSQKVIPCSSPAANVSEFNILYENAPDVDTTIKTTEKPKQPRRPLVSDLVAQMEKQGGHPEPTKTSEKSPRVFHRALPPRDLEVEKANIKATKSADKPRSDGDEIHIKAFSHHLRPSDEVARGRPQQRPVTRCSNDEAKPSIHAPPVQSSVMHPTQSTPAVSSTANSIPKPFQPMPFKRQEPNGIRSVKAPTVKPS